MNTAIDRNFDGKLSVENRYDYLNLEHLSFYLAASEVPVGNGCFQYNYTNSETR